MYTMGISSNPETTLMRRATSNPSSPGISIANRSKSGLGGFIASVDRIQARWRENCAVLA
jgi:hypothetical protein